MSTFAELNSIADEDVKVILGSEKKTNDLLITHNPELETLSEQLDDVENRNSVTIQLMQDTDIVTESRNLTESEFVVLSRSLRAITRTKVFTVPALESGEKPAYRAIAMEGFKETLKKFWSYIKNALSEFWNMLKRWWYRTFDISKRTLKRAKDIQERADKEYGSTTDNELYFPEIKRLAMNGKLNDIPLMVKGLKDLEEIVCEFVDTHTSERFNDAVDTLSDQVNRVLGSMQKCAEDIKAKAGANDDTYRVSRQGIFLNGSDLKPLNETINAVFATNDNALIGKTTGLNFTNVDKYKKQYGEFTDNTKSDDFLHSEYLPGDKWLLSVKPKDLPTTLGNDEVSANDAVDYIRRSRIVLAGCMYASKTYDGDSMVKVLQPTIISRGCESAIEICEYVNEYRLAFERREKFKDRVIKEIDQAVSDTVSDEVSTYGEVDRLIRSFANAVTGLIRRRSDFETNLCAYAIGTIVAFLNYGDLSLKKYTN